MTQVILLFGLGLLLVVAEVLIPSMGILGMLATVCIVGAVGLAFSMSNAFGVQVLVAAVILVPVLIGLGFKLLPRSPLAKKLIAGGFSFEDGKGTDPRDVSLAGEEGITESVLRPSGVARIQGRRVDVVSRGEMIQEGQRVRVIDLAGNRVVVARVDSTVGGPD
jgi:membrane-bound serine protease (ClpP class)